MAKLNSEINTVIKNVSKQFGEGSLMIMGDTQTLDIQRVTSGSLNLDLALGGGMPLGRTIEIFGPESAGKTTVAILHAAQIQKEFPDKYVALIDMEHATDPKIIKEYGVDMERFAISQPDTGEQALDIAETLIRSNIFSLVIIDSVSALLPEAEDKAEMRDQQMGLQARLLGKALRKLTPTAHKNNVEIIYINQLREKIGVLYGPINI